MAADGDPHPAGAPPPPAFYGLWPRFADPADEGTAAGAAAHREQPRRNGVAWPSAFVTDGPRPA